MRSPNSATPDDIDLTAVGAAARRALPKLLVATLLVGAVCWAALSTLTPKYASQAQVEIIFNNPIELRRGNDLVSVRLDKEAVATHVRALMSSDLALKLAADMRLSAKPEFNGALARRGFLGELLRTVGLTGPRAGETEDDRVLAAYYDALRVYQVKDTRGIVIEFRSEDPKLAAEIANRLAELYRDDLSLRTVVETRDARTKLEPQIRKLADEAAAAESEVTRFRGQANIFDGGRERTGLNEQQLTELTAEQTRASTSRAETEARARSAREQMLRGSGEALPDVQKSQLVPRLVEQRVRIERQVAELSATLLPAHPRMKQLSAELAGLNRQIRTEVEKVVDSLEREVKVAGLREDNLKQRIDETKGKVVSAGNDDVKLRALESIAKSKRTELERLQGQLESARTTSDAAAVPGDVQIISRARASSEKAWPKVGMISLLAMTATLLLGLALAVTRELFAAARQGTRPVVREHAPARMATFTPPPPQVVAAPRSTVIGTIGTIDALARHLDAKAVERGGFRTLFAGEDAASTAIGFARHLAGLRRQVIVLDWSPDASGSGLGSILGLAPAAGLRDVLAGRASFEDVIGRVPGSEAHLILIGTGDEAAIEVKDRDRVNMLLDALDEAYDHVVVAASRDAAHALFTTIEGRIDAGVLVREAGEAAEEGFLGYKVADLDVIQYQPDAQPLPESRAHVAHGLPV